MPEVMHSADRYVRGPEILAMSTSSTVPMLAGICNSDEYWKMGPAGFPCPLGEYT